tara:strand:- start:2294 stop:3028 length:735 start_codon:yes stop_codon:yes gene_type:complete
MSDTLTLSVQANTDTSHAADVISQVYRQVFGNRHLMELDINPSLEALFMNGDLSVQGFVTALAQSETYRKYFLEPNSAYRFVELNFKHLLGRAPRDQAEVMEHVSRLAEEGYEAEIASYTCSEEYLNAFGLDQVPFARTQATTIGGRSLDFSRSRAMDVGTAGFDGTKSATLLRSLGTSSAADIINRKSVGCADTFTILWTSGRQIGANRRACQRSVVKQSSMSMTIQGILSGGGRIQSIQPNG